MVGVNADIYTDFQGLAQLKADSAKDPQKSLEQVAEQFEALLLQTMLKGMRKASLGDGLFDNDQSRMFQEMFDQQLSIDMAKKRQVGVADAIIRQLQTDTEKTSSQGQLDYSRLQERVEKTSSAIAAFAPSFKVDETIKGFDSPQDFVNKLGPLAEKIASKLGVEPEVLLAQAALETGWGQSVTRYSNGVSTHNLFNIKADSRWDGHRAVVPTMEYEHGLPVRQYAAFRSYPSFEASFEDYASFVQESPRYQHALEQAGDGRAYIKALHEAGYATDPEYSNKINGILSRPEFVEAVAGFKNAALEPIT